MTTMIVAPACLLQCPQCLVNIERGQLRGGYLTKSSICLLHQHNFEVAHAHK